MNAVELKARQELEPVNFPSHFLLRYHPHAAAEQPHSGGAQDRDEQISCNLLRVPNQAKKVTRANSPT